MVERKHEYVTRRYKTQGERVVVECVCSCGAKFIGVETQFAHRHIQRHITGERHFVAHWLSNGYMECVCSYVCPVAEIWDHINKHALDFEKSTSHILRKTYR